MRRVTSRQRLVSWDAFDANAVPGSGNDNECPIASHDNFDEESYASAYEMVQNVNTRERKGMKSWTRRRRKRDRKSLPSHGTTSFSKAETPNALSSNSSTLAAIPTVIPSYSWECSKPKPLEMIHFDDLIEDLHIGIFSFLDLSSLRSVMSINRYYRNLMFSYDARNSLWMEHCKRIWHLQLTNRDNRPIKFVDNFCVAIAATSTVDSNPPSDVTSDEFDTTNLPLLLNLAPAHFPTSIDYNVLSPRSRLSRTIQQTIPVHRRDEEDQLFRCFQDNATGRTIIRYTGFVGQGDRCIRSNHPLPRPSQKLFRNSSHQKKMPAFGTSVSHCIQRSESHRPFLLNILRSKATRSGNKFSAPFPSFLAPPTDQTLSTSAPFVVPFVDRSINNTATVVNITPRYVSYFEVGILESQVGNNDDDTTTSGTERRFQGRPHSRRTSYSDCVAVGVATKAFQFQSRMPGWDQQSYGYHGDDGGIFHSSGGMLKQYGPKYGPGDTVGCGIDYYSKAIFYTLNGEFLGYAWEGISDEILRKDLFPVVGIDSNSPIYLNFGSADSGPFQFDLSNFIMKHHKLISPMFSHDSLCSDTTKSTQQSKRPTRVTKLRF